MTENKLKKIKVLIVDDSMVSQKLYKGLLSRDDRFELVGIASDGQEAIDLVVNLHPDVVSMDINMPLMDGIEATSKIMQLYPIPILIVSSLYQPGEMGMAMEVLEAGALNILQKPYGSGHPKFEYTARKYLNMLQTMSEIKVVKRRTILANSTPAINKNFQKNISKPCLQATEYKVIVIGASAGGPEAIKTILNGLNQNIPVPVLVVQHIDSHFAEGYCDWLRSTSNVPIHIAAADEVLIAGHAYFPPGDQHLILKSETLATISGDPPLKGLRPSVGHLFNSAAKVFQEKVIAVILSGMGKDGADELKLLKNKGALTLVQDEESCLVFGMPGEAVKLEAACKILPPQAIVDLINQIFSK